MTAASSSGLQKPERDPRMGEPLTTGTPPAASRPRYATIVADPPWAIEWNANVGNGRSGRAGLPYPTMTSAARRPA